MKLINFILVLCLVISCKKNKPNPEDKTNSTPKQETVENVETQNSMGIYSYSNVENINQSYKQLKNIFDNNKSVSVLAELNHTENAKSVGLDLNPTKAIFFGNPNLGTPLMQINPLAGLDLPQKIVFLNDGNKNRIIYNDMTYLNDRYQLNNHQNITVINNTLKALVQKSSGSTSFEQIPMEVSKHQGIITKKSKHNFDKTLSKLLSILENHKALKVIAKLNHQNNAKKAGLEMTPSYLVVFGNPKMGSPLMQDNQNLALDLPQKMLIWEDKDGQVSLSYNDIYFIAERHQLTQNKGILDKISGALDNISTSVVN